MNAFIVIALIFFILIKLYEIFVSQSIDRDSRMEINSLVSINEVNMFIRKETCFEVLKWITENRFQKNTSTGSSTFVSQINNSTEIKKRTAAITSIVAEKMSPTFQKSFNRYYKKELEKIDKRTAIDVALREYIARYVYFIFRRIAYDVTTMINSNEYKDVTFDNILNVYIVSLEETIYRDNNIYLIGKEQNNVE